MAGEKYVLVSLEDEKAGKLANVLANKTSKKILSLLAEKELSESEISKELNLPLNTVGYNINNLNTAGLIEEKRHLFSIKGKRISIYKLSNKHIIISPRRRLSEKLKNSLPVVVLASIFSVIILWYENFRVEEKVMRAEEILIAAEKVGAGGFFSGLSILEWFLILMWFGIIIFFIWLYRSERRLK